LQGEPGNGFSLPGYFSGKTSCMGNQAGIIGIENQHTAPRQGAEYGKFNLGEGGNGIDAILTQVICRDIGNQGRLRPAQGKTAA